MNDVQFGDLVGRMAISLAVVLGLMFVAYRILKRRQSSPVSGIGGGRRTARTLPVAGRRVGRGRGASAKQGLKVIGRLGLSRNNAVLAVQFGERIFMVGTSEQGPPSVLAEIDAATWVAATTALAADEPAPTIRSAGVAKAQLVPSRMGFVEALREATTRRG